jgi:hypothetical protein
MAGDFRVSLPLCGGGDPDLDRSLGRDTDPVAAGVFDHDLGVDEHLFAALVQKD